MTALAVAAPFLALASVTAIAWSILAGHEQPVRYAILRARWAWRCRGCPPVRSRIQLEEWERAELHAILRGRKKTARPERSRT